MSKTSWERFAEKVMATRKKAQEKKLRAEAETPIQARVRDWVGAHGFGTLSLETRFEMSLASFNYGKRIPHYYLTLRDIQLSGAFAEETRFHGNSVDEVAQKAWDFIVRNGGDK